MPGFSALTNPTSLYSRSMVMDTPSCPVPKKRGLCAWFFKNIPPMIPVDGCITKNGNTLLYVGISPSNEKSKGNIHKRIKTHFSEDASTSTLRQSLGVLLGFSLRFLGDSKRLRTDEQRLNDWMDDNAFVCWFEHPAPWEVKKEFIQTTCLPLNIQGNSHPFADKLKRMRNQAKQKALVIEGNQQR